MSLFKPEHSNAPALLECVRQLAGSRIAIRVTDPATGETNAVVFRERFVPLGTCIVVQGDDAGLESGLRLLEHLDLQLGEASEPVIPEVTELTRTVRLRSLSISSAQVLLESFATNVQRQFIVESGMVVLKGATADVARAESLLLQVDQPAPQMTLHVRLIEATQDAGSTTVGGELGKALASLMPGQQFREVGRQVLRASVTGSTALELRTHFGALESPEPDRFLLRVPTRAYDAENRTLLLGQCEVQCQRHRPPQKEANSSSAETYERAATIDSFATDLTLQHGQETVVGSLGAQAMLVVVRFTVD